MTLHNLERFWAEEDVEDGTVYKRSYQGVYNDTITSVGLSRGSVLPGVSNTEILQATAALHPGTGGRVFSVSALLTRLYSGVTASSTLLRELAKSRFFVENKDSIEIHRRFDVLCASVVEGSGGWVYTTAAITAGGVWPKIGDDYPYSGTWNLIPTIFEISVSPFTPLRNLVTLKYRTPKGYI